MPVSAIPREICVNSISSEKIDGDTRCDACQA